MKVLVINGSPHLNGCTDRALREVENTLHENGVETERVEVGNIAVRGCVGCNYSKNETSPGSISRVSSPALNRRILRDPSNCILSFSTNR